MYKGDKRRSVVPPVIRYVIPIVCVEEEMLEVGPVWRKSIELRTCGIAN